MVRDPEDTLRRAKERMALRLGKRTLQVDEPSKF
jgi:hypothetical protein